MRVSGGCPSCQQAVRAEISSTADRLHCEACDWSRPVVADDIVNNRPRRCLMCGCDDLWRQKDFPQKIGVAMVGVGILISTIAYYNYWIKTAIAVLVVFALVDMLLFWLMTDVLVCYRCGAAHRRTNLQDEPHPAFDLEVAERYRQQAIRLAESQEQSEKHEM